MDKRSSDKSVAACWDPDVCCITICISSFDVVDDGCRVASGCPVICLDGDDKTLVWCDSPCCVDCVDASTDTSNAACREAERS